MAIKTQSYKLIQKVIDVIDLSFKIKQVDELIPASGGNYGTYKLYSCDTAWLSKGFTILIGVDVFTIQSFEPDNYIIVTGPSLPTTQTINIYPPVFMKGTILAAVKRFDQKKFLADKLPMIWLHDLTPNSINLDLNDPLERDVDCELFFLIDADFSNWDGFDLCKYGVQPMRNLYARFIDALEKSPLVKALDNYTFKDVDIEKFGVEIRSKGETSKIFNAFLSGVQLNITIPFVEEADTCC